MKGTIARSLACLALAAGLAGCGLSHAAPPAPAAPAPPSHPTAKQIYALVERTMQRVHTVVLHGYVIESIEHHRVRSFTTIRVQVPGRVEMTTSVRGNQLTYRYVNHHAYFQANANWWYLQTQDLNVSYLLAHKWFILPGSSVANATDALAQPHRLARCLVVGEPGRLRFVRSSIVQGVPVWVLHQRLGSIDNTIKVSSIDPHIPMHISSPDPSLSGLFASAANRHGCPSAAPGASTLRSTLVANARKYSIKTLRAAITIDSYDKQLHLTVPSKAHALPKAESGITGH